MRIGTVIKAPADVTKPEKRSFSATGTFFAVTSASASFDLEVVCTKHHETMTVFESFRFPIPASWGKLTQMTIVNASTDKLGVVIIANETPFDFDTANRVPPTKLTPDYKTISDEATSNEYNGINSDGLRRREIVITVFTPGGWLHVLNDNTICGGVGCLDAAFPGAVSFHSDGNFRVTNSSGMNVSYSVAEFFHKS